MQGIQLVPVEDLVLGLYVNELDRPWLETPFLFQGFPIESSDDIAKLQAHCNYVYVDAEKSDRQALAHLQRLSKGAKPKRETPSATVIDMPPPKEREQHRDVTDAFGDEPYPDTTHFSELLHRAKGTRDRSRRFVDHILDEARFGNSIDTSEAREHVQNLVDDISENASAALWLTNLKERDEYTHIHCLNVCVLSIAFARHLGLRARDIQAIGLGALLHDVGKVRTPDEVLNKPGKLTAEEFSVMRRHPEEGYEILRATGRMPPEALDIVRFHHERLSGRGYPLGLKGEEVTLPVRIVALADVYDALTSDRVYRDGMPADKALKILFNEADGEFGQELVEEFIKCMGIYPVGSLVELDTGAQALVIASDRKARLHPVVRLVRTPDGEIKDNRVVVNMAAMAADTASPTWSIRRVLNPREQNVDIASLLEEQIAVG